MPWTEARHDAYPTMDVILVTWPFPPACRSLPQRSESESKKVVKERRREGGTEGGREVALSLRGAKARAREVVRERGGEGGTEGG